MRMTTSTLFRSFSRLNRELPVQDLRSPISGVATVSAVAVDSGMSPKSAGGASVQGGSPKGGDSSLRRCLLMATPSTLYCFEGAGDFKSILSQYSSMGSLLKAAVVELDPGTLLSDCSLICLNAAPELPLIWTCSVVLRTAVLPTLACDTSCCLHHRPYSIIDNRLRMERLLFWYHLYGIRVPARQG